MNQKDKKTNDELNMKDVSNSDNINYVNGKNASVTNDSFVIKDLSFEDFKFDAKVKDGDASFEETEEKASSNKNDDNNKSTDNKDSEKSDNNKSDDMQDISDNDSSNNNDMQDVSDNDNADNSDENNAGDSLDGSGNEKNDNQTDEKNNEDKDKNPQSPDEEKKDDKESDDKKDKDDKESDDKKDKDDKESEDKKDKDSKNEKDDKKDDKGSDNKKDNNGLDDKKNNDDKKENNDPNKKNNDQNKNNNNQNTNDKNKPAKDDKNNDTNKDKKDKNKKSNNDNKRPNPYQRKKDDLKNKWNNRPKNFNDVKNRAKSGLKNKGKDALNNSAPGRAVNKAKETVEKTKKTVETTIKVVKHIINFWYVYAIGLGILAVVFVIIIFCSMTSTGVNGDINEDDIDKYEEKDQKVLEELNEIFKKYPGADGTIAMATVALPYYEEFINGNVMGYLNADSLEDTDKDDSSSNDSSSSDGSEKHEDTEDDDTDNIDEDVYLKIFRKGKIKDKLEELLKQLNGGEENYKTYLKDNYFEKDNGYYPLNFLTKLFKPDYITGYGGYKGLFKEVKEEYKDKKDELKEALIENIYEIKDDFSYYVNQNLTCSTTLVDAGKVNTSELLKSAVKVDLRKPGCSNINQCEESYYDTPLTLEEYVKGVVYEEISDETNVNVLAAQMVAAKTFTLSRRPKKILKDEQGNFVIPMVWSTADQDFCHIEKGCNSSDIKAHYGYNTGGNKRLFHGANRGPASDEIKNAINEAWELSKNVYMVTGDDNKPAATGYYEGSKCTVGTCMEQKQLRQNYRNSDFKNTLTHFYSSYKLAVVEGEEASLQTVGAQVCTDKNLNAQANRNKISTLAISLTQLGIPYYNNGLASSKVLDENNFGSDVVADSDGRTKKGLNEVGFVNFVYWNIMDVNFGNTTDINKIINDDLTYSIDKESLLVGDIGYSNDKTLVGIYLGNDKWAFEDATDGKAVAKVDNRFTNYRRLNAFKEETYNFTVRSKAPTVAEWKNLKNKYDTNNTCQCVWYAKNRAIEIINELYSNGSLTKKQYDTYIKRISDSRGNGNQFTPNGKIGKFYPKTAGSTNIEDYKSGSFIGAKSWYSDAGKTAGHVIVIEYASRDENKIITTDGYKRDTCNSNNYLGLRFNYDEYTYEQFYEKYKNGDGKNYDFYGYLYFLQD